jgi:hypothetical protein
VTAEQITALAALVTAVSIISGQIVTLIVARRTKARVEDVHEQVTTSNGESLASIVEGNDLRYLDPADPPPSPEP